MWKQSTPAVEPGMNLRSKSDNVVSKPCLKDFIMITPCHDKTSEHNIEKSLILVDIRGGGHQGCLSFLFREKI